MESQSAAQHGGWVRGRVWGSIASWTRWRGALERQKTFSRLRKWRRRVGNRESGIGGALRGGQRRLQGPWALDQPKTTATSQRVSIGSGGISLGSKTCSRSWPQQDRTPSLALCGLEAEELPAAGPPDDGGGLAAPEGTMRRAERRHAIGWRGDWDSGSIPARTFVSRHSPRT